MIRIVGLLILFIFSLFALWVLAKIVIEANHIINKKLKKTGHNGSYKQYKKSMEKKKKKIR